MEKEDTQAIRISNSAYQYLKTTAETRKEPLLDTINFIIAVFQQINNQIISPNPKSAYINYRNAFYEQNKHKLEDHQRAYYESSKKRMNEYYESNKQLLMAFRVIYNQERQKNKKKRLKQYNKEYYLKQRKVPNA